MSRGTRAILSAQALRHNLGVLRARVPESRVMAVVKANAYGHGLERVVSVLEDVDGFAVATLCEAHRVREVDPERRVLLLEGVTTAAEMQDVHRLGIDLVVHSDQQLDLLENEPPNHRRIKLWLKVDTGMNRLGFRMDRAAEVLDRLRAAPAADSRIILMSHLANADDLDDPTTRQQLERFASLKAELGLETVSMANSAGAFGWPESTAGWVRCGLALMGESPLLGRSAEELGLRPCMTLRSTLLAVNACRAGDRIGYGGVYRCPEDMPVGVVAIGYGDGYPRNAGEGTPVLVDGVRCPLVGRVSMDMLTVDLRPLPTATVGTPVVLWGEGLPVAEVARGAGTIPYELLCGVTARVESEWV